MNYAKQAERLRDEMLFLGYGISEAQSRAALAAQYGCRWKELTTRARVPLCPPADVLGVQGYFASQGMELSEEEVGGLLSSLLDVSGDLSFVQEEPLAFGELVGEMRECLGGKARAGQAEVLASVALIRRGGKEDAMRWVRGASREQMLGLSRKHGARFPALREFAEALELSGEDEVTELSLLRRRIDRVCAAVAGDGVDWR